MKYTEFCESIIISTADLLLIIDTLLLQRVFSLYILTLSDIMPFKVVDVHIVSSVHHIKVYILLLDTFSI